MGYGKAKETFSNMVKLAKTVESGTSDTVGYGLASKPVTDMSQDSLWKAMLHAMRILEKPGSPTVTDNIRVLESAQEITYRPVINGVEAEEERVFALRKDPLRFEMFCRNSKDEMRLDWQTPKSVCLPVFDSTIAAAQRM